MKTANQMWIDMRPTILGDMSLVCAPSPASAKLLIGGRAFNRFYIPFDPSTMKRGRYLLALKDPTTGELVNYQTGQPIKEIL